MLTSSRPDERVQQEMANLRNQLIGRMRGLQIDQFIAVEALVTRLVHEIAEKDVARRMLDYLCKDLAEAFGVGYAAIIDEASGDISVNTAMKVALRDEREAHRDALDAAEEENARLRGAMRAVIDEMSIALGPSWPPDVSSGELVDQWANQLQAALAPPLADARSTSVEDAGS